MRGDCRLLTDLDDIADVLENIRRIAWNAIRDDIRKHGLRVIENSVKKHSKYGMQIVIVIQEGEHET
jgi:hypothetical protein